MNNDLKHLTVILPLSPEFCWFAQKTDVSWLTDPGLEEGQKPLRGYDMAVALERTASKIRAREYREITTDHGTHYEILIDVQDLNLSKTEKRILEETWFSANENVMIDPWSNGLPFDGKHRLWPCFSEKPDTEIPVYSMLLTENLLTGRTEEDSSENEKLKQSICAYRALEVLSEDYWKRNPQIKSLFSQKAALAKQLKLKIGEEEYRREVDKRLKIEGRVLGYSRPRNEKDSSTSSDSWWSSAREKLKNPFLDANQKGIYRRR